MIDQSKAEAQKGEYGAGTWAEIQGQVKGLLEEGREEILGSTSQKCSGSGRDFKMGQRSERKNSGEAELNSGKVPERRVRLSPL